MTVRGLEKALGQFHDAHAGRNDDGDTTFSFKGSVPTPSVLSRVISSHPNKKWRRRDGTEVDIKERTLAFLRARYGADCWYEWQNANWGTKWDAGTAHFDASPGRRLYEFSTAWGPPVEWAKKASLRHPSVEITIEYDEPGMCFAGTFTVRQGEVTRDEQHEYESEEVDE
jgi:hypothetical protein